MAYTIRPYDTKGGRRYEVRYRKPDGTATGKRGFKRKMDADAWGAANVTTAKTTGAYIDPQAGRRRVEDFWEPWIAAKKTVPLGATSISKYFRLSPQTQMKISATSPL